MVIIPDSSVPQGITYPTRRPATARDRRLDQRRGDLRRDIVSVKGTRRGLCALSARRNGCASRHNCRPLSEQPTLLSCRRGAPRARIRCECVKLPRGFRNMPPQQCLYGCAISTRTRREDSRELLSQLCWRSACWLLRPWRRGRHRQPRHRKRPSSPRTLNNSSRRVGTIPDRLTCAPASRWRTLSAMTFTSRWMLSRLPSRSIRNTSGRILSCGLPFKAGAPLLPLAVGVAAATLFDWKRHRIE